MYVPLQNNSVRIFFTAELGQLNELDHIQVKETGLRGICRDILNNCPIEMLDHKYFKLYGLNGQNPISGKNTKSNGREEYIYVRQQRRHWPPYITNNEVWEA